MSAPLTLPQARIPLGWVMLPDPSAPGGKKRMPVEIDIEWMRAFLNVSNATDTNAGGALDEVLPLLLQDPGADLVAREALQAAEDLRNELDGTRNELRTVRAALEEMQAQLAGMREPQNLMDRITQIEDRLA